MAINGVVHAGFSSEWGIVGEPTAIGEAAFGTANATTAACEKFDCAIPSNIDHGLFRDISVKHGDGRMANVSNDYVSAKGGLRVIPFSDMIVRQKDLGALLYAVTQVMDEGETPFEKSCTLTTATTQPDFSADAGFFATIGIKDTIASYHRMYYGCILRTLTLSSDLTGDGLLRASGEWITGFPESTTTNFTSGTWAFNTQAYYDFHVTPTKKIAGTDIVLYGFDITINNNAVRIGDTGATGNPETYGLGRYDITGNIKCKFDVATQGMFAAEIAGTDVAIQLACGTDGAAGNFDFTGSGCLLDGVGDDYENAAGRALDIPFTATSSAIFTCTDGLDRAWPT